MTKPARWALLALFAGAAAGYGLGLALRPDAPQEEVEDVPKRRVIRETRSSAAALASRIERLEKGNAALRRDIEDSEAAGPGDAAEGEKDDAMELVALHRKWASENPDRMSAFHAKIGEALDWKPEVVGETVDFLMQWYEVATDGHGSRASAALLKSLLRYAVYADETMAGGRGDGLEADAERMAFAANAQSLALHDIKALLPEVRREMLGHVAGASMLSEGELAALAQTADAVFAATSEDGFVDPTPEVRLPEGARATFLYESGMSVRDMSVGGIEAGDGTITLSSGEGGYLKFMDYESGYDTSGSDPTTITCFGNAKIGKVATGKYGAAALKNMFTAYGQVKIGSMEVGDRTPRHDAAGVKWIEYGK